jgi:hypothetical protein
LPTDFDQEIEAFIRAAFDDNYDWLTAETGAGLAPDIRRMALEQALYYWRRLKAIAVKVTETEVRLNMPGLESPAGREYGIEGIVDIVQEDDATTMYDIKTQDPEYARTHLYEYASQLSVYAHIWQRLRGRELHDTAVIATSLPEAMREAIACRNVSRIASEMKKWQPLIPIPFDSDAVQRAIEEFGEVVDSIEEGAFAPRATEDLAERPEEGARAFATRVCRNCDARFSCVSYRRYSNKAGRSIDLDFETFIGREDLKWVAEARLEALIEGQDSSVGPSVQ